MPTLYGSGPIVIDVEIILDRVIAGSWLLYEHSDAVREIVVAVRQANGAVRKKEYKLESLTYYSKLTLDKEHIIKASSADIQEKLDSYAQDGWRLTSTDATSFGSAVYIYLYFERDKGVFVDEVD